MTYKNAMEEYLRYVSKDYRYNLVMFQKYCATYVKDITKDDWDRFEKFLLSNYKSNTVRDKLTKVKCFLNFCINEGWLKINTRRLKIPRLLSRRNVATIEEWNAMVSPLNEWKFNDLQIILAFRFMLMGMRIGEIRNLNKSDFQLQNFYYENSEKIYFARIMSEKSHSERYITWKQNTQDLIIKYLGVLVCKDQSDAFFVPLRRPTGRRISVKSLQRMFKKQMHAGKIDRHLSPHTVRHLAAHLDLAAGANIKQIQARLGHSNPESTLHYIGLSTGEILKTMATFTRI